MRGLLDIFGLISTNTELLRRKLQQDHDGRLEPWSRSPARSLGLALGQLLVACGGANASNSTSSTYARRPCAGARATTRLRDWHERLPARSGRTTAQRVGINH